MTDKHDFKAALGVCERWLKYIEQQKQNSITMQKAAALARKGDKQGAKRLKSQVDNQPRVFDGANFKYVIPEIQTALRLADRLQGGEVSKPCPFESGAFENLKKHQGQLDMDGICVSVSREALTYCLNWMEAMAAQMIKEASK